tara:strand:+ start:528 stop:647 length:120 start_codon:yes stop_codon:yes gene_type:complete
MYNFILAILFASVMFILGNAVGIDGVIEIGNKISALFSK